jgi:hypothetical protein
MARTTSRGSVPTENRPADFPHTHDEVVVRRSRLHDHMLRDHGRTARETDGMPLEDLHRFEHVEQSMGLNDLGHHHPADGETDTRILVEPAEAPITAGVPA